MKEGKESAVEAYSRPVQGSRQPGFSHIYRNSVSPNELVVSPVPGQFSLKKILLDLFLNKYKQRPYLAKIQVDTVEENGQQVEKRSLQNILTYKEGHDLAVKLASGLLKNKLTLEVQGPKLNLIGIYCRNRPEFYLADLACILYGITSVPLYDTLGIDNLAYCLEHTNITTCICGDKNAKTLLSLKNVSNLKNIILCDQVDKETEEALKKRFDVFYFWKLIEAETLENAISYEGFDVDPGQCFTFSYTSGTTGFPKGAMLSHKNFLSFISGLEISLKGLNRNSDSQVHLSILPMPHVYQRIVVLYEMYIGSLIVPTSGNILKLKEDIALVRPTQLICVPRIYNRMMEGIFQMCGGEEGVRKLIETKSPVLDKIRQGFGGRVKFILTGSAPISPKIMRVPFIEAYGQTENTGGAFVQNLNEKQYGKLGHIWPSLEFKLSDIPEMGYTSDDKDSKGQPSPRGQIWLRGTGVILGYYKSKELTDETFTADGWLKTGDVGVLTPGTNTMKLIDRKKNIFKLSQGQYVASEKVECFYLRSKYVTEAFLHGDSLQSYPVCIIVPNKLEIQKLGASLEIQKPYLELCRDKLIIKKVLADLTEHGHEGRLNGYEQAKNIRFQPEAFILRGIVSSTMKLQRFQARKFYKQEIDEMYAEGPLVLTAK